MTDTEVLDFLQELVVDTIYLDSGEVISVAGGDLRAAVQAVVGRARCEKCSRLLEEHQVAGGWCDDCLREEEGDDW